MVSLALIIAIAQSGAAAPQERYPLFEGIGRYRFASHVKDALAAKYNTQGMAMLYGFNYQGARNSFAESINIDPKQVLAHWGVAMSHGSTINWTSSLEDNKAAIKALAEAKANRNFGSGMENDLVDAALLRFDEKGYSLRLEQAYSDQMRKVYGKYPNDPDVASLFAESILNLRPWKQWTLDGKPEPGTGEALKVLRHALDINQNHPQALHLWIHTVEGSKEAHRGLAEAYRLMNLQPDLAHMQHMPSHIFDRTGKYDDAIRANLRSIACNKKFNGDWSYGHSLDQTHARHMIVHAASMSGRFDIAMQHLNQMFDGIPVAQLENIGFGSDFYVGMKYMLLVRFGKWQRILDEPAPPAKLAFANASRLESMAVAYAAMGNVAKARETQAEFAKAIADPSKVDSAGGKNRTEYMAAILEGEILVAEGKLDDAVKQLQRAVTIEDAFGYNEPPDVLLPARHTLGAALVEAGRFKEAVDTYREDLAQNPNNGWALFGLHRAYAGLNMKREADRALANYKAAWVDADVATSSSCLCMPEKKKKKG